MVIKFCIEKASAKIRNGGPAGDEELLDEVWSGHIPLQLKALTPIQDKKFGKDLELCNSVKMYLKNNG
ncbi:MAG: hypothetical protein ACOYMA_11105 [Bacteroidia bacterium]